MEKTTATGVTVTKSQELIAREAMAQAQFDLTPMGQMIKQFEAQQRMGQMFAKSKIVPQAYRDNVADCAIAIDMAMRMNCNPLTVMQNLVIVQGRPTWQAQFLIACINQCGRFTTLQYKHGQDGMVGKMEYEDNEWDNVNKRNKLVKRTFDGENVPNYTCQAFATDMKTGEIVYGAEISVKMAVMERWYTKSGSKWQTMPKQMLIYRAASFFQRAYCPEIGMGFHTTEEVMDMPQPLDADVVEIPQTRRTLQDVAKSAVNMDGGVNASEGNAKCEAEDDKGNTDTTTDAASTAPASDNGNTNGNTNGNRTRKTLL